MMRTSLKSETKEVVIGDDGPVIMIGEKINPTGRKKLAQALQDRDFDVVRRLVANQVAAGADLLDVNVGVPGLDDVALLPEVIQLVMGETDLPLCIDTASPEALEAALPVAPGKPLVNSVNGEEASLDKVLPLVKDRGAAVIGLTMDDNGIPDDAKGRFAIAEKILERAARIGIQAEDVVIDPLVLTIGADTKTGMVTLRAIAMIRDRLGVNINLGASNISFGMPERHIINQVFLALAIESGATCLITDPARLGLAIRAAELILGRDDFASRYISLFRTQQKK
ncbi:MAG: dihydropteroate synthase [Anaerolineales bacterium]|nr:dihydropteroate synthase [Anaerolineales bacterium]